MTNDSDNAGIALIEVKLADLGAEIRSCEERILKLRSEASVLTEALDVLKGNPPKTTPKPVADHVEAILLESGPMKVQLILEELAKRGVYSKVQNITGLMSRYMKAGKRFTRPAPATYGLLNESNER